MSLLNLSRGKKQRPEMIIVFGPDGVGKSTFAANAPGPTFVDIDDGSFGLNVARIEKQHLRVYEDVVKYVNLLIDHEETQTIVIDSLDRLEDLVWDHVVREAADKKVKSIEDFGYGKGYVMAAKTWSEFIAVLKRARTKKNVIMIAHDQIKTFKDPTKISDYDRHEIKLHKSAASLLREEVDAVLFAKEEVMVRTEKGQSKGKGIGDGVRLLYTERRPAHEGKNRFGLPYEIPLDWSEYVAAKAKANENDPEVFRRQIEAALPMIADEIVRKKVAEAIETEKDADKLKNFLNRVNTIIGEQV